MLHNPIKEDDIIKSINSEYRTINLPYLKDINSIFWKSFFIYYFISRSKFTNPYSTFTNEDGIHPSYHFQYPCLSKSVPLQNNIICLTIHFHSSIYTIFLVYTYYSVYTSIQHNIHINCHLYMLCK